MRSRFPLAEQPQPVPLSMQPQPAALLALQQAVGNRSLARVAAPPVPSRFRSVPPAALLARKAKAPQPEAPRFLRHVSELGPGGLAALKEDCMQAVVQNETRGSVRESDARTTTGKKASYKNSTQMIASAAVEKLKHLSKEQQKMLGLESKDITAANNVVHSIRSVYVPVVLEALAGGPKLSEEDVRRKYGKLLVEGRLYEQDDVPAMLRSRDFLIDARVAKTDEERKEAAARHGFPHKPSEVKLLASRPREDLGGWYRRGLSRPPQGPGKADDRLDEKLAAATGFGGGYTFSRWDIYGALDKYLAAQPDPTEEELCRAAALWNHDGKFKQGPSKEAEAYAARVVKWFREIIRKARYDGDPIVRTGDPGPGSIGAPSTPPAAAAVGAPSGPAPAAPAPATATGGGVFGALGDPLGTIGAGIAALGGQMGAMARGEISDSVGRRGANHGPDVLVVQTLLQRAGVVTAPPKGEALGDAIAQFQADRKLMKKPDGTVEPGKGTLKALREAASQSAPAPSARIDSAPGPAPAGPASRPPAHSSVTSRAAPGPAAPAPAAPEAPAPASVRGLAPSVDAVDGEITRLEGVARSIPRDGKHEETGTARDGLVKGIDDARDSVGKLQGAGLDPAVLGLVTQAFNLRLAAIAPFYSQGRNINFLEGGDSRTCNLTVVSMCLEGLGKAATDCNQGVMAKVDRIYEHYAGHPDAKKKGSSWVTGGDDRTSADPTGMRMPDFAQLVAVAVELTGDPNPLSIDAAMRSAYHKISKELTILENVAIAFGVKPEQRYSKHHGTLTDIGESMRLRVDDPSGKRHAGKLAKDAKYMPGWRDELAKAKTKAQRERIEKKIRWAESRKQDPLSQAQMEARLPLSTYRASVKSTFGADLAAGKQLLVNLVGHYVRLQSIGDKGVVVDDPNGKPNRFVTWEDARAMGYFRAGLAFSR